MNETAVRGGWATAAFFAVLVVGTAFALDPGVQRPYVVPRAFLLITFTAGALVAWSVVATQRRLALSVSVVELLLVLGIALAAASNPELLRRPDHLLLPIAVALLLVTFLTRQLVEYDATGGPARRRRAALVGGDLLHATWINGVALALLGLRQALDAGRFRYQDGLEKTPMVGTLGTANAYGALVALGAVGAIAAAWQAGSRGTRAMLGAVAVISGFALVANGSRGALLGALVGAAAGSACVLWTGDSRWGRLLRRRAAAFGLGALALVGVLVTALALVDPGSSGGRLLAWRISLPMALENPVSGVGAGRFGAEYAGYQAAFFSMPDNLRWAHKAAALEHPHSDVLHPFAETGVPGGVLSLALWTLAGVLLARGAIRRDGPDRTMYATLLALLLVVLVHGTVDTIRLVVPVAVVAHAILGLVPAPVLRLQPGRPVSLLLIAAAVGYAGLWAVRSGRQYPAYQYWLQGSIRAGSEAVPYLRRARADLPSRPQLARDLGTALLAAGEEQEAIKELERALEDGGGPGVRLVLTDAYLGRSMLDLAQRHAEFYLSAFPDQLRPRLLLGRVYLARGEHDRARDELARCIRRETRVRSMAVEAVAREAEAIWEANYDDAPPAPPRGG